MSGQYERAFPGRATRAPVLGPLVLVREPGRTGRLAAVELAARIRAVHIPVAIVNIADLEQDSIPTQVCAVVGLGTARDAAAHYALDRVLVFIDGDTTTATDLVELVSGAPMGSGPMLERLGERRVVAVERVEVSTTAMLSTSCAGLFRWDAIAGPVVISRSRPVEGNVWLTVMDGPAVLLAASPPHAHPICVELHGDGRVDIDGRRQFPVAAAEVTITIDGERLVVSAGPLRAPG